MVLEVGDVFGGEGGFDNAVVRVEVVDDPIATADRADHFSGGVGGMFQNDHNVTFHVPVLTSSLAGGPSPHLSYD